MLEIWQPYASSRKISDENYLFPALRGLPIYWFTSQIQKQLQNTWLNFPSGNYKQTTGQPKLALSVAIYQLMHWDIW